MKPETRRKNHHEQDSNAYGFPGNHALRDSSNKVTFYFVLLDEDQLRFNLYISESLMVRKERMFLLMLRSCDPFWTPACLKRASFAEKSFFTWAGLNTIPHSFFVVLELHPFWVLVAAVLQSFYL